MIIVLITVLSLLFLLCSKRLEKLDKIGQCTGARDHLDAWEHCKGMLGCHLGDRKQ